MSGFLHQLASRSLGLAPQIKSRAALPYAAPAADLPMAETGGFELPPAAPAIVRQGHEVPLQNTRRREHEAAGAPPRPIFAEKAERAASGARQEPHAAADSASQPARDARPPWPGDAAPEIAHSRQLTPHSIAAIVSPVAAEPKHIHRHPGPAPEIRHPGDETQGRFADLEALVSRLLGDVRTQPETSPDSATPSTFATQQPTSQPAGKISTIRALASRERPTTAPEIDSAPEVHITIGRLEVNPPTRPAPAAPPPRPRSPAPLSLSDYLARRHGGRS
jgi:hypothetical protein